MVPGNCDFGLRVPAEITLEVEGLRVLITHGNRYGVKSGLGRLISRSLHEKDRRCFIRTHPYSAGPENRRAPAGESGKRQLSAAVAIQPMPFSR